MLTKESIEKQLIREMRIGQETIRWNPFTASFKEWAKYIDFFNHDSMGFQQIHNINDVLKFHFRNNGIEYLDEYDFFKIIEEVSMLRKMFETIKKDPKVEKEWNKFLMFWRLSQPEADKKSEEE